jgi:hypothetical protein
MEPQEMPTICTAWFRARLHALVRALLPMAKLTLPSAEGMYSVYLNLREGDTMTELLKKAFEAVSKLPPESQDAIAARMLMELEDESRWDETFAKSQDKLARMADEAIAEFKGRKTVPLEDIL